MGVGLEAADLAVVRRLTGIKAARDVRLRCLLQQLAGRHLARGGPDRREDCRSSAGG
jgi:hypothetical protein